MNILVTGGAGFIGSNFLRHSVPRRPGDVFVNVDKLTYAANPANLAAIEGLPNYSLERIDIADAAAVADLFERVPPDLVVHFAAESHVDRSIDAPSDFIQANIVGTFVLLEAFRRAVASRDTRTPGGSPASRADALFHHVSTDEVYGSLGEDGRFSETTRYDPSSPYSASKAASDHLVRAYERTYGLPVKITNCSNNYGPFQFPEKLIPLMILNALERRPLPVYGKGMNVRDWLYVEDHCEAIWAVIERGRLGETYNIGGNCEMANIDVVRQICRVIAEETGSPLAELEGLITYVTDRPGHDLRYAIDADKVMRECGWAPRHGFESGLRETVRWYLVNGDWVNEVRSGDYRKWIAKNYENRG